MQYLQQGLTYFVIFFMVCWFIIRPLSVLLTEISRRKNKVIPNMKDLEGVSFIVPCHNEEESIREAVLSILNQKLDCPKEIILVENNSTDNTFKTIKKLEKEFPEVRATTIITPRDKSPISVAMNHGIFLASFPIVVRLDADTYLRHDDVIKKAITPIYKGQAVMSACNVRIANIKQSIFTRLQSIEYFFSMEMDRRSQSLVNSVICSSGAMQAFRLDLLKEIGGYHTGKNVSEDMEITLQMHKKGKVVMVPDAISYTDAPHKLTELLHQRKVWMILGVLCLFIHKKGIGNFKYGRKGVLGLVGLPMKAYITFAPLIDIGMKTYLAIYFVDSSNIEEYLSLYGFIACAYIAINLFMLIVVRPVSVDKQGSNYWYMLPLFILIYQPILALTRAFALIISLKFIITNLLLRKESPLQEVYGRQKEVA